MPYTPIGWKDFPNEETPLSATNLNKMDQQIKENTEKLDNFDPYLPENLLICDGEAPEETETLPNVADRLTDETASYTASDIKNEFDEVKDNLDCSSKVITNLITSEYGTISYATYSKLGIVKRVYIELLASVRISAWADMLSLPDEAKPTIGMPFKISINNVNVRAFINTSGIINSGYTVNSGESVIIETTYC